MEHHMRILIPTEGDEHITWSPDDEKSVNKAKKQFKKYLKKGWQAFRVTYEPRRSGEPIKEFDPQARELLLVPGVAGG